MSHPAKRTPRLASATRRDLERWGAGEGLTLLQDALALHVRQALSPADCARAAAAVAAAREHWVPNFEAVQYTLGRAWYTHLEEGQAPLYFADAERSNAIVRRYLPHLAGLLVDLTALVTGGPAALRTGWCGPGVHIFPAHGWLAEHGGEVHYDSEGLTEEQLRRRAPTLSLILMLQPPEAGGALRVWDRTRGGSDEVDDADLAAPWLDLLYEPGDLAVIDGYRLHQIQPFTGNVDRVSGTAHAVLEDGVWQVWF